MRFLRLFSLCVFVLLAVFDGYSQLKDSVLVLKAFRPGVWINPATGERKDFSLCGDEVSTDSIRFFTMISGCERNVHASLGKYTFKNDTFYILPFDFIMENPFLKVYKKKSTASIQTIQFLSADYQQLNGRDSSWIVRCFRRRKQTFLDCSTTGIVTVNREKYDGIEILQLSKIFGGPIVFFLDKQFDYLIIVNMPVGPLKRFITGANAIKGQCFIKNDSLYFERSIDGFKISGDSRK